MKQIELYGIVNDKPVLIKSAICEKADYPAMVRRFLHPYQSKGCYSVTKKVLGKETYDKYTVFIVYLWKGSYRNQVAFLSCSKSGL